MSNPDHVDDHGNLDLDLDKMSEDDLVLFIEQHLDFEPQFVRQILSNEGASEFKRLLKTNLQSQLQCQSSQPLKLSSSLVKTEIPETDNIKVEVQQESFFYCINCNANFMCESDLEIHQQNDSCDNNKIKIKIKSEAKIKEEKSDDDSNANTNANDMNRRRSLRKRNSNGIVIVGNKSDHQEEKDDDYNGNNSSSSSSKSEEEEEDSESEFSNQRKKPRCSSKSSSRTKIKIKAYGKPDRSQKFPSIYKCLSTVTECGRIYTRKTKMHDHMIEFHLKEVEDRQLIPIFTCPLSVCEKKLSTVNGMQQHLKLAHPEDPELLKMLDKLKNDKNCSASPNNNNNNKLLNIFPALYVCELPSMEMDSEGQKCGERFGGARKLKDHQNQVHGFRKLRRKPLKLFCHLCEILFKRIEERMNHEEEIHKMDKPHKCSMCWVRFGRTDHLRKHELTVHKENPEESFNCPEKGCSSVFSHQTYLQNHIKSCHAPLLPPPSSSINDNNDDNDNDDEEKLTTQEKVPSLFYCPVSSCKKLFRDRSYLNGHIKYRHPEHTPFSCPVPPCSKKFALEHAVQLHVKRVHSSFGKLDKHKCDFAGCDQIYKHAKSLREHKRIHSGNLRFTCDVCGKRINLIGNLKQHMRLHTNEKPYKCTLPEVKGQGQEEEPTRMCTYTAAHNTSLQHHIVKVHGVKKFPCTLCPPKSQKFYAFDNQLRAHIRSQHTGERPYLCDVDGCTNRYASRCGLRLHKKSHKKNGFKLNQKKRRCQTRKTTRTREESSEEESEFESSSDSDSHCSSNVKEQQQPQKPNTNESQVRIPNSEGPGQPKVKVEDEAESILGLEHDQGIIIKTEDKGQSFSQEVLDDLQRLSEELNIRLSDLQVMAISVQKVKEEKN